MRLLCLKHFDVFARVDMNSEVPESHLFKLRYYMLRLLTFINNHIIICFTKEFSSDNVVVLSPIL